jgi:hypothetical protein
MSSALLDANTLIAAFDESHADHARARAFLDGLEHFYSSPQTRRVRFSVSSPILGPTCPVNGVLHG